MKLELKHLAPYLPYSLKVVMEGKKTNVAFMSTKNIAVIIPSGIGEYKKIAWKNAHLNIQPILRPLSDFEKVPAKDLMVKFATSLDIIQEVWMLIQEKDVQEIKYKAIQMMCKNHIDFNRLIEKGLAIDINTLNK